MADYEIHSEARSGHWVAWVTVAGSDKPAGHVVLVGQTQQEAEAKAGSWQERLDGDASLLRT